MKEQDLMCIKLHGVNRIGLKKIIDFIYTAKLSLNMENLQDTLEAASFLQILPVLDFCKVFLISGERIVSIVRQIYHNEGSINTIKGLINRNVGKIYTNKENINIIKLYIPSINARIDRIEMIAALGRGSRPIGRPIG